MRLYRAARSVPALRQLGGGVGVVKGRLRARDISALRDHESNQHTIANTLSLVDGDEAFGEFYFHA